MTDCRSCFNPACGKREGAPKEFKLCGRCKTACYCTVECQRTHWKAHKPECPVSSTVVENKAPMSTSKPKPNRDKEGNPIVPDHIYFRQMGLDMPITQTRSDSDQVSPKPPVSLKKAAKRVASKTVFGERAKRYGYSSRYTGMMLMDTRSQAPIASVPKILPCTRADCDKVETPDNPFDHCEYCLTSYCGMECMKADPKHDAFCRERAYYEQQDKFQDGLPPMTCLFPSKYLPLWDKWIQTEHMRKVLKRCKLNAAELRSKLVNE